MIIDKFKLLLKSKHKLLDVWSYFLGNLRFKYPWIMRKHIKQQIHFRITSIKKECIGNGACIECGCNIPELVYANKHCEGFCYPTMLNKIQWGVLTESGAIYKDKKLWYLNIKNQFDKFKYEELG